MEKRLKCGECPRTFDDQGKLARHQQQHNGVKPYLCPYCQKSFSLDYNLRTHLRVHTGERPFKCPYPGCTKACSQPSNLNIHMKQVHGQVRSAKQSSNTPREGEEHLLITGTLSQVRSSKPGSNVS